MGSQPAAAASSCPSSAERDAMAEVIQRVTSHVEQHMAHYDASHDMDHVRRVVGLARHIAARTPCGTGAGAGAGTTPDPDLVTLCALLHDVGDRKYLAPGREDAGRTAAHDMLLACGAPPGLARAVQELCLAVSWQAETADPTRVRALVDQSPELAAVQDADRLDALGAVGIARVFTYGGAKTSRGLDGSVAMFDAKLLHIRDRMKTEAGRELAEERTRRLQVFMEWWDEETEFASDLGSKLVRTHSSRLNGPGTT